MSEIRQFTLHLEQVEDFEFKVRFDWPAVPDLLLDEPAPLGSQGGPNAARLIAAGVANCLSASLLFCLQKSHNMPGGVSATVTGSIDRNDMAPESYWLGHLGHPIVARMTTSRKLTPQVSTCPGTKLILS
jgi:hypothetical protein